MCHPAPHVYIAPDRTRFERWLYTDGRARVTLPCGEVYECAGAVSGRAWQALIERAAEGRRVRLGEGWRRVGEVGA